ncbi:hypothetical protein AVEN_52131-1 [Araneus ventricosus]|uniref:Uncharacterized protein n=1 Tax=Araneus ventricosus TaxID=182803 RepID=A0A4Y2E462_ARAVE|nr:hypothetical protein AVEN_52131-1 [Araneus ventricosus]
MRTSAGISYSRIEITKDSRTKCLGRVHESRDEVLASHCNPPRAVYSYRKSMSRIRRGTSCERSANTFEESFWIFICSAGWKAGELSAIESAVSVIISELLSVCVARSGSVVTLIVSVCVDSLYNYYCSSYLCFVFPEYL